MLLAVSSALPCSQLGDDEVGNCGFVQPPPGQSWPCRFPTGLAQRGFCAPHILASRQRFWHGLRDMVAALKEGAALSAGVSVPPATPRDSALGPRIRRRGLLAELHP